MTTYYRAEITLEQFEATPDADGDLRERSQVTLGHVVVVEDSAADAMRAIYKHATALKDWHWPSAAAAPADAEPALPGGRRPERTRPPEGRF